jgi:hypothetical protein
MMLVPMMSAGMRSRALQIPSTSDQTQTTTRITRDYAINAVDAVNRRPRRGRDIERNAGSNARFPDRF